MKQSVGLALLMAAVAGCAPSAQESAASQKAPAPVEGSWGEAFDAEVTEAYAAPQFRQFDFWIGEWEANWRSKPQGEFYHEKEGTWTHQRVFPALGGKALIELAWDRDKPGEASQRGFSIRYYDTARERWVMAQNWPNATNNGGAFLDQLIGDEHLGRLTMYSVSERPQPDGTVLSQHRRYNFTDIRPGVSFRWDGSNTPDNGATWFTWYVVDFLRQGDLDPFGPAGTDLPGVHGKNLCTEEPHGAFNSLGGVWTGTATDAAGAQTPARLSAGLVLDGCGVLAMLDTPTARRLLTFGYHERFKKWVMFSLDDLPGTNHAYFVSDAAGEGATFTQADALAIKDEFTPYLRQEAFNTRDASRRLVVERMNETSLILRAENRNGDHWTTSARYDLHRE